MTTNQTIDGVPRGLLERVTSQDLGMSAKKDRAEAAHELRALLDAPESQSGKLPPVGRQAVWQAIDEALTGTVEPMLRGDICNALAALLVPAAQQQGEPAALDERALYDAWRESNLGYVRPFNKYEWSAWQARARITKQPAPVADPLAKGFTTLESDCGKYKIVTSFATRDDAWSAYRALVGAKPAPPAHTAYDGFDNGVD